MKIIENENDPYCLGFYQSETGATSCQACPDTQTTVDSGSTSLSDCKDGCTPGTASASGLEPCQPCPAGEYQEGTGALLLRKIGIIMVN